MQARDLLENLLCFFFFNGSFSGTANKWKKKETFCHYDFPGLGTEASIGMWLALTCIIVYHKLCYKGKLQQVYLCRTKNAKSSPWKLYTKKKSQTTTKTNHTARLEPEGEENGQTRTKDTGGNIPTTSLTYHNETAAWCSEIGSLVSLYAWKSGASSDVREPISLHQAVLDENHQINMDTKSTSY